MPPQALRLGVIGLGSNWTNRYRPALLAARSWFEVRVLCDAVQQRAAMEANRLGCDAAEGPSDLLNTPDLDAVLLTDALWYGLWPLELACRQPRPFLCVPPLTVDAERAASLSAQVRQAHLPVMFEMRPRFTPATVRLRRLLHRVGGVRAILCQTLVAPQEDVKPDAALTTADFFELIDWCLYLIRSRPARVWTIAVPANASPALASLVVEFVDGRVAQINRVTAGADSAEAAQVVTDSGTVYVRQPDQLRWLYRQMESAEHLPGRQPIEVRVLRQFHRFISGGSVEGSGMDAAEAALRVADAARESLKEGRAVDLPPSS